MGSKSTTTSEASPPAWSKGGYEELGAAAQDWYKSGAGGNVYQGSAVAPLSDTTMQGINQQAQAGQNWDTSGARSIFQGLGASAANDPYAQLQWGTAAGINNQNWNAGTSGINPGNVGSQDIQGGQTDMSGLLARGTDTSGIHGGMTNTSGLTPQNVNSSGIQGGTTDRSGIYGRDVNSSGVQGQQVGTSGFDPARLAAMGIGDLAKGYGGIASGQQGINTEGDWRTVLQNAQAPSAADQYLKQYASGDNLKGEGNPFYRARLESDLEDTASQVRSLMSGSGRYGSDVGNRMLADELGTQRNAALEQDWNREQANQFNAVGMMDAGRNSSLANQIAAVTGISGVQGQNIANRLSALGSQVGAQSDMAGQLRGIAGDVAGVEGQNADRSLQAAMGRAGIEGQNADRGLQAGIANANFSQGDMQRMLDAALGRANVETGNADRALDAGNMLANYSAGDQQRSLDAAMGRAGFSAGDADRSLQAGNMRAGYSAGDQQRSLDAAMGRAGVEGQNADRQFEGQQFRSGVEQGNLDRLLQGFMGQGSILANAGQQSTANRGQMMDATNAISNLDQRNFQNQITGAGATLDAGRALDQQSQGQLMDEISKFYEADNADLTRLGMYSSILGGASGPYGSQLSTSRTSNPMAAIGGIGSALGGLKSDIRLKQDITRIGHADNGLPIYLFRYRDDPEGPFHIGYMAQDVIKKNPGAVLVGEDGYFRVDYASASIQKEAA